MATTDSTVSCLVKGFDLSDSYCVKAFCDAFANSDVLVRNAPNGVIVSTVVPLDQASTWCSRLPERLLHALPGAVVLSTSLE